MLLFSNHAIAEGIPSLIGTWKSKCLAVTWASTNPFSSNSTGSYQYVISINKDSVGSSYNSYGNANCNGEPSDYHAYGYPNGLVKTSAGSNYNEIILESYYPDYNSIKTRMIFLNDDEVEIKLLSWKSLRPIWEAPQKTIDAVNLDFRRFTRVKE